MKIKILLILLIAFSISSFAQTKKELKVKDFFWGENDTHKNAVNIPEQWKNESAVILYKNQNYDYHNVSKNVTYTTSLRKRVKLLDISAVKEFSEFSFSNLFQKSNKVIVQSNSKPYNVKQKKGSFVGIKVVKPSGKEIEIDIEKESVEVDGKIKIAISNLEVGDIIDYYMYNEKIFKFRDRFGFDPIENTLAEEYPILDFKLFFETENNFYINFNSFNGAPELKKVPSEKNRFRRYSLEAFNIDKYTSNRWLYPLVDLPAYKFKVCFSLNKNFDNSTLPFFSGNEEVIIKQVTKEEVLRSYKDFYPKGDILAVKDFLKGKKFNNDTEKVTAVYYYMRHFYLTRYIEAYVIKDNEIHYDPGMFYSNKAVAIKRDKQFIRFFTEFLKQQKIDYEIVISKKRFDGTIDDLLIKDNVNILLKVNTKVPIYLDYFGPHTSINQYSPLIENTDAYFLSGAKNKVETIRRDKLIGTTHNQNKSERDIKLTINDDFSNVSIDIINSLKGHQKENEQYDRLIFSDYVYEDYKKYETETFIDHVKNKKVKINLQKKLDAFIEKLKVIQEKKFKSSIEYQFDNAEIKDYTYKIDKTGRYGLDSCFIYKESFKLHNTLIKKAGPNYIIEIGKLITAQISLTEKERTRKENIYMPYPRSYENKITFNIPKGYKVSGIEKLNVSIDNSTGAFISEAKIENDKLIILTSKHYKNYYEPKTNWNLMVKFLDAANQFTNEKILLQKL